VGRRGEEGDPDKHSYSDKAVVVVQAAVVGVKRGAQSILDPRSTPPPPPPPLPLSTTTIHCGRRTPLRRYIPRITRVHNHPRGRRRRTVDGQNSFACPSAP